MSAFSLNHLDPTEFEEFCYDLLGELEFINVSWRKGTGLSSSPSDHGRDIECEREQIEVDGTKYFSKWFVECKHYKKGVPPDKLQGILTWATAENPDTVLIIVSNFLSNPSKDFLDNYKRTNNPRFKIKVWERPDLERLTLNKSKLLRKYNVVGEFSCLSILHPAHLVYLKDIPFNSIDYFFETLDKLDPKNRDHVLDWAYYIIIRPRYREPIIGKEKLSELIIDDLSYDNFKNVCYQIVETDVIDEIMLVFLIVSFTLQSWIAISDTTSVDEFIHRLEHTVESIQRKIAEEPEDKEALENAMRFTQKRIQNAHESLEANYRQYEYFCEKVVSVLLQEDIYSELRAQLKTRKRPNL